MNLELFFLGVRDCGFFDALQKIDYLLEEVGGIVDVVGHGEGFDVESQAQE